MEKIDFNRNWRFWKEGGREQEVTLPHDAMLQEERRADNPSGAAGAYFSGGKYHYRKHFTILEEWKGKTLQLYFEGVYQNAEVFLNGRKAGGCAYGYTAFLVPLEGLVPGEENTVEVIADNSQMPNTRWYSGSGIFRPVFLLTGNPQHILHQGVRVTTLSTEPAKVRVETAHRGGWPEVRIWAKQKESWQQVAGGRGDCVELKIPDAGLWSEESPRLYRYQVILWDQEQKMDEVRGNFGIRKLTYGNGGFFINGKETLLRGCCIHHDHGVLGAKSFREAEWRRVRILKEAGFNAIRSSHNPCSEEMLNACDHYGMYVIDETWDMWYGHKNPYDYADHFPGNYRFDLESMVKKDYNHPCVILYSIGNEVAEPITEKGLSLEREMVDYLHEQDASRPVTGGFNIMIMGMAASGRAIYDEKGEEKPPQDKKKPVNSSLAFNIMTTLTGAGMDKMANTSRFDRVSAEALDILDIAGYNYAAGRYPKEGKCHPGRLIIGSETFQHAIVRNWGMVKKYPYLIGDFLWAGWDYLGEAGSGAWGYTDDARGFEKPYPWLLADMGVIDILGNPGGALYLAQAAWGRLEEPKIAVRPLGRGRRMPAKSSWRGTNGIPSWSWAGCEGEAAVVEVYSAEAAAELYLNGKKLGKKRIKNCKAVFRIKYQPGILEAVEFNSQGKETGRSFLVSAQGQVRAAAVPECSVAAPAQVFYVSVCLQGENGVVESNADRRVSVETEGGELLGFGSANPRTEESYLEGAFTTYYGYAQAVVRAGEKGKIRIRVRDGKDSYFCEVPVREEDANGENQTDI